MQHYSPGSYIDTTSPLQTKYRMICEKLHTRYDTTEYHSSISKAIDSLYRALRSQPRFQLFTNSQQRYVKTVIKDELFIPEIVLYVAISQKYGKDEHDAVTYSYDTSHEPIVPNEQPLCIVSNGKLVKASIVIILSLDAYVDYRLFSQKIMEIINHELIHVYHETTGVNLNKLAGDAYYSAQLLCDSHNIEFDITYSNLINLSPIKKDILLVYSALMYYCDPSEMSAFMQTLNQESKKLIWMHKKELGDTISKTEMGNMFNKVKTYKLYSLLYKFVQQYKFPLKHIQKYVHPGYQYILNDYFDNFNTKETATLTSLPDTWERKLKKFLTDAQAVHVNNVIEKFKTFES